MAGLHGLPPLVFYMLSNRTTATQWVPFEESGGLIGAVPIGNEIAAVCCGGVRNQRRLAVHAEVSRESVTITACGSWYMGMAWYIFGIPIPRYWGGIGV